MAYEPSYFEIDRLTDNQNEQRSRIRDLFGLKDLDQNTLTNLVLQERVPVFVIDDDTDAIKFVNPAALSEVVFLQTGTRIKIDNILGNSTGKGDHSLDPESIKLIIDTHNELINKGLTYRSLIEKIFKLKFKDKNEFRRALESDEGIEFSAIIPGNGLASYNGIGTKNTLDSDNEFFQSRLKDTTIENVKIRDHEERLGELNQAIEKMQLENENSYSRETLFGIAAIESAKDEGDLQSHIERMPQLGSVFLEILMNEGSLQNNPDYIINPEDATHIADAMIVHDVGKVYVNDEVLLKPGRFTTQIEVDEMEKHTIKGGEIFDKILERNPNPKISICKEVAKSHHERWDGKGYPEKISGKTIPLSARIAAILDSFDAALTPRRYKGAKGIDDVHRDFSSRAGSCYDPVLMKVFLKKENFLKMVDAWNEMKVRKEVASIS